MEEFDRLLQHLVCRKHFAPFAVQHAMSNSSRTAAVVALVTMLLSADGRAASPAPPASTADLLAAFAAAGDESAQSDAARALIGAPDRKAVAAAMAPLLAAPDRRTRCNAGWVLAATGDA